jgi:hypothetical protein
MAWTTDDVAKVERAIAGGKTRVTFGDRTVQYADLDAMRRARREMLDEIAAASPATKRKRIIRLTQTGTGL